MTLRLILLHLTLFTSALAPAATLTSGGGRFEVRHAGRAIPVHYFIPDGVNASAPVLIVMHGVKRDADRYRDEWTPHAKKHGFILAAPEFSNEAFPGGDSYTLESDGAFTFIEPVFDALKAATGNRSDRYFLYGHSAGAQFVHRFLYFVPGARVEKAVAANAGWWTLPDLKTGFPYGLRGSMVDEAALKAALQRPLTVLLGAADTDPNDEYLRRTPEAMAQGPHRFARGHTFFDAGKKSAAALRSPFGWQLLTAPGVGHSDKGMSDYAARVLFGQPVIEGRDPKQVRVLFGGDTGGGGSYQEPYAREGGVNILAEQGYEHCIAKLSPLLHSS